MQEEVRIVYELRQEHSYPLLQLLKVANLAKSTYYDNIHAMNREDKNIWLKEKIRVKRYKSYKGEVGRVAPNILNRKFDTTSIN